MTASRNVFAGIALLAAALLAFPGDASSQRRGKEPEKVEAFPNATREAPEGRVSSRLQRQFNSMIEALNKDDDPAKARKIADELIANDRASAFEKSVAAQVAGNAANDLDDIDASIAYYQLALEQNGLDNDAHFGTMQNLAITLLNNDDAAGAITLLQRLIDETNTEKADIHYALAGAYLQDEQYPKGIEALKRAISLSTEPKDDWQKLLMTAHLEAQQPNEALAVGEALLAKSPDDKRLLLTLASAYLDLEQPDKAIGLLEGARARGLLTETRDYQTLYSLYFNADGREKDVISAINEGLEKGLLKRDLPTLGALAQAAYFADDMPLALATYKEAAAVDPKGETGLNYAKVLSGEGEDAAARDAAKAAIAKGVAKAGDAWMVIARSENQLDNVSAARAALAEAAKFPETREQANRMLSQFR